MLFSRLIYEQMFCYRDQISSGFLQTGQVGQGEDARKRVVCNVGCLMLAVEFFLSQTNNQL